MKLQCREPHRCRRVLPDELVYDEILTRLVVHKKTLARFLCVSKAWNSVISSPPIKHDKPLRVMMLVISPFLYITTYNSRGTLIDKFRISVPCGTRPVQAVHGLLCFAGRYKKEILLYNPSTRESVILPPRPPEHQRHNICIGFGHAASTNEFKVVRFSGQRCLQILTLGWRSGCTGWRKLATRPPYRPAAGFAPFVNGALHLLPQSYRYELPRDTPMVAFDLDTEEYREFQLPQHYYQKTQCEHREQQERLTELQGSLCFIEVVRGRHIVLWLLKDYHDSRTWVREYNMDTFRLPNRGFRSSSAWPCLIKDDGRLLMVVPSFKCLHEFWRYDPRHDTFSVRKIGRGAWSVTVYQERFLPPLKQICAVREAK